MLATGYAAAMDGGVLYQAGDGERHPLGAVPEFITRPARLDDTPAMAQLLADVAEERDRIGTEPPVDIDERAVRFAATIEESTVAAAGGRIVGMIHVEPSRFG